MLTIHSLNDKWEPCHVTIGFLKIVNTPRSAMALKISDLLAKHGFNACVIAYVKDEVIFLP